MLGDATSAEPGVKGTTAKPQRFPEFCLYPVFPLALISLRFLFFTRTQLTLHLLF